MRGGIVGKEACCTDCFCWERIGFAAIGAAVLAPDQASSTSPVANPVLMHALDVELGTGPGEAA